MARFINVKGIVIIAAALIILQLALGALISPFLGPVITENLNKYAGTKVSIGKINVWPLTLSCSLKDLKVFDPDNEARRIAFIPRASMRVSFLGLLSKRLVVSSFKITGAEINLKGEPDGSFNIQKLAGGVEGTPRAPSKTGFFDRFKGKQDWFSRIFGMIKKRSSKEALEKKEEERRDAKKIQKEVLPLPRGRRVLFKSLSDGYLFQIRDFAVSGSRLNIETGDGGTAGIGGASIVIKRLGIDPVRGVRFDKMDIRGLVEKAGSPAGSFNFFYEEKYEKGMQKTVCALKAEDVDLTAVSFIYDSSLPVDFKKGIITISSDTVFLNENMDSKNYISLKDQEVIPRKGANLTLGVVPLPVVCDALNKINPASLRFDITGTIEKPVFTGFQESLMALVKPYIAGAAEDLKQQGLKALTGFFNKSSAK
ncbi:MAG: hypothetical protein ABH883_07500 [Candidatus Omnitrophota bacterium]